MKSKIKFQFDANQDYQLQAINSTVDLFEGMGNFCPEFSLGNESINPPGRRLPLENNLRKRLITFAQKWCVILLEPKICNFDFKRNGQKLCCKF